jgi:hypothetical protein
MKTLACLILASSALASPVVCFAQSTAPVTPEQVRADLIRLEAAGYHVGDGDNTTYPVQIQAAEAKVAAQDSEQAGNAQGSQQEVNDAVGGTTLNGTSASGGDQPLPKASSSSCSGPASYCNLFFGH